MTKKRTLVVEDDAALARVLRDTRAFVACKKARPAMSEAAQRPSRMVGAEGLEPSTIDLHPSDALVAKPRLSIPPAASVILDCLEYHAKSATT